MKLFSLLVVLTVALLGWLDLLSFMLVVTTAFVCLHMAQPAA